MSEKAQVNSILIVKPSSLGDIVHCMPAVMLIHNKYPDAKIDWLIHPAFADILDYLPFIRKRILFDRKNLGSPKTFLPAMFKLFRAIRSERYDMVIDFQGLLRSASISRLARAGIHAGLKRPKEQAASLFYSRKISPSGKLTHALEKNVALAAELMGSADASIPELELPVIKKNFNSLRKILAEENCFPDSTRPFVTVIPGARWETKKWPPAFFADVLNRINQRFPAAVFLLAGAASDKDTCVQIKELTPNASVFVLAGRTGMGELLELMRQSSATLTNDSGPMHIAAALKTPVFALFGPTSPEMTGPYGMRNRIFTAKLDCIKCLKKTCPTKNCHSSIKPETVASEIITLLEERMKK